MGGMQAKNEREQQFIDIFLAAAPKLRKTAYRLTGDWVESDDLVQTTYVKATKYIDRICEVAAPEAYLKQILTRTCIDARRKKAAREYVTDLLPEVAAPENGNDDRWAVRVALAAVPPSQRQILILRYYADMSVADTARALGCSVGNVKSQASRGLGALARGLADSGEATSAMPYKMPA